MEESSELPCEENKSLPEKNKKRRFKTPSQLQGLEDFYNEHKYPTESLKAEVADKLGLTEKQVSGWFCHRRLKDKRLLRDEGHGPGRQDLSSGIIQDRGSGLRQDSCSSTKEGDYRLADVREVESRRFLRDNLPSEKLNYEQRRVYDGNELEDTSSESNSDLQESVYPHMETTEYRAPNGFFANNRGRVGPSGYLKIKRQTENAAITAVKRQLGRHYQEDGPPLGIEFDSLPPGAFESSSKDTNNDAYIDQFDNYGIHRQSGLRNIRNQDTYVEAKDCRPLHKSDEDYFAYRKCKMKRSFADQSHVVPGQKYSVNDDSYSARETPEYDSGINHNIQHMLDMKEPWSPNYENVNPKVVHRRGRLESVRVDVAVKRKNTTVEDRVPSSRILEDEEVCVERRPFSEHHDAIRLKTRPTNELRAGDSRREEFMQQDYSFRTSFQELPQWSRQIKGSTAEIPSSFSEDETAETSSSMD